MTPQARRRLAATPAALLASPLWDGCCRSEPEVAHQLGHPTHKGIPAVAMLASGARLIKATEGGELAGAKRLGDRKVPGVFDALGG